MKDTLNTIQTLETGISSRGTIRTFRSLVDITVGSELCQTLLSKNYGDMSPQVVVQVTFRDCCCQRGLAMIDVPNCSDIAMGLVSLESFRKGARNRTFQLSSILQHVTYGKSLEWPKCYAETNRELHIVRKQLIYVGKICDVLMGGQLAALTQNSCGGHDDNSALIYLIWFQQTGSPIVVSHFEQVHTQSGTYPKWLLGRGHEISMIHGSSYD